MWKLYALLARIPLGEVRNFSLLVLGERIHCSISEEYMYLDRYFTFNSFPADTRIYPAFANSVVPDQMADLTLHCLPLSM